MATRVPTPGDVDNELIVLVHARALLANNDNMMTADLRNPRTLSRWPRLTDSLTRRSHSRCCSAGGLTHLDDEEDLEDVAHELKLVEPGLVANNQWCPGGDMPDPGNPVHATHIGGFGRKP